jgi:hypothetical protein
VARACYERSLSHAREHHDERGELDALTGLADYEQALAMARTMGDLRTIAVICHNRSIHELLQGNLDASEQFASEALVLAGELHLSSLTGYAITMLGGVAISRVTPSTGHAERVELLKRAQGYCLDALDIAQRTYDEGLHGAPLHFAASVAYHAGDSHRAVILRGMVDALVEQSQNREPVFRERRDREYAALREVLDPADFDRAYQNGSALSLTEAITVVRDIAI